MNGRGLFSFLLLVSACARVQSDAPDTAPGASAGAAGTPGAAGAAGTLTSGVGPIRTEGEPAALPMACDGAATSLELKLPCLVGKNLTGRDEPGWHVVECELVNQPAQTAVTFALPLVDLPHELNQPLPLPFDGIDAPPSGSGAEVGAERFVGTLSGVLTVSEVDPQGRAFVADLAGGRIDWNGNKGTSFQCTTLEGPFWAMPGNFL